MSGKGEWHTDGPVVVGKYMVGKYTKTRQRWLMAKIVKSGHDRHYIRRPLPCPEKREEVARSLRRNHKIENKGKRKERKR